MIKRREENREKERNQCAPLQNQTPVARTNNEGRREEEERKEQKEKYHT